MTTNIKHSYKKAKSYIFENYEIRTTHRKYEELRKDSMLSALVGIIFETTTFLYMSP